MFQLRGEHAATSRTCPVWKREKEIVTIKYKESLSFPEARKIVNNRLSLNNMYSTVTKSNVSAPKEMKNVQTQTSDVTVQTVSQAKPESSGRKAQKPTEKPKGNTCK